MCIYVVCFGQRAQTLRIMDRYFANIANVDRKSGLNTNSCNQTHGGLCRTPFLLKRSPIRNNGVCPPQASLLFFGHFTLHLYMRV
jgi:hypothetical protein